MQIKLDALISMTLYASIVLLAPGPTNTLLLASGLTVGVKRTLPLVAAEVAGYVIAIAFWGTLLTEITTRLPWALNLVKLFCCYAVLSAAIKLWKFSPKSTEKNERTVGIKSLFFATLNNPKALIFAGVIFPGESFKSLPSFAAAILLFVTILIPIGIGWSAAGTVLAKKSKGRFSVVCVTKSISVLLLFSAITIFSAIISQKI